MEKKNQFDFSDPTNLRKKAEEYINSMPGSSAVTEADMIKLIFELQVHQIELLMQNEELQVAKNRAELAEKKYTGLYESAPSGHLTLSKEGDILDLNNSAIQLLQKNRSQLLNTRFSIIIPETSYVIFFDFFDRVFKSHQKESFEMVLNPTGNMPVYLNIDGIISEDHEFCLLTMTDITKSKQAEESIYELKLAKEALKFKQNFLANVSHEMRTPLTGILGIIDLLENTRLSSSQKEYIYALKLSSENLREIINQVLDYSKIEAGKTKLSPKLFAPGVLLDETLVLHQGIVKPEVQFSISADSRIPEFVFADEGRIRQIINNFISNALKFTNKGSVILNSELISVNDYGKQIIIKISVTDTGMGIPKAMQNKLFVPFSQIDDHDSRHFEGTGLGLSICKALANLMGGEIGVTSTYHKGSSFWFTFPALVDTVKDENIITRGIPLVPFTDDYVGPQPGLRILYAEDKAINQKVVSLILESMGHVVTIAGNGQIALQLYEPGKFDLILMDIQMPVMDGITAMKKLRESFTDLPPIIGLSANAFEGDRDKYMNMGLDDYLTKPFERNEFNKITTGLLSKHPS
jgi:PAS domain S-box-containing protein